MGLFDKPRRSIGVQLPTAQPPQPEKYNTTAQQLVVLPSAGGQIPLPSSANGRVFLAALNFLLTSPPQTTVPFSPTLNLDSTAGPLLWQGPVYSAPYQGSAQQGVPNYSMTWPQGLLVPAGRPVFLGGLLSAGYRATVNGVLQFTSEVDVSTYENGVTTT